MTTAKKVREGCCAIQLINIFLGSRTFPYLFHYHHADTVFFCPAFGSRDKVANNCFPLDSYWLCPSFV